MRSPYGQLVLYDQERADRDSPVLRGATEQDNRSAAPGQICGDLLSRLISGTLKHDIGSFRLHFPYLCDQIIGPRVQHQIRTGTFSSCREGLDRNDPSGTGKARQLQDHIPYRTAS